MDIESKVIEAIQGSVGEAVKAVLSRHDSPLNGYVNAALDKHKTAIHALFNDAVGTAITDDFGEELREALSKKLAKVIVSKMEGEIEKRANDLRSDPVTRAKITLAVQNALNSIS